MGLLGATNFGFVVHFSSNTQLVTCRIKLNKPLDGPQCSLYLWQVIVKYIKIAGVQLNLMAFPLIYGPMTLAKSIIMLLGQQQYC